MLELSGSMEYNNFSYYALIYIFIFYCFQIIWQLLLGEIRKIESKFLLLFAILQKNN